MNPAYISAFSALAGATIGGFTSFATSWLTQRTQLRHAHREAERAELKTLYQDFMTEASRLFVEAMRAKTDDIDDISGLVGLHAMIGRMRLVSDQPVIDSAMQAEEAIVETYLGPDRTIRELMDYARHQGRDELHGRVQRDAGIIADDVVPGDILESRLAAWRKRMSAVAERVDLVRVIRRRRAAAMLPPATAMTWAHASPDGPGVFSIARSVPGFGLT